MEIALGDLGFDIDVSEAAGKKIGDEGEEPKPDELSRDMPYTPETWDEAKKMIANLEDWSGISSEGLMLEFRRIYRELTAEGPLRPETWAQAKD